MNTLLNKVRSMKDIELNRIIVENGALQYAAQYLLEKSYRKLIIAADTNTYEAAGKALHTSLSSGSTEIHLSMIHPDEKGDVIADEAALIQLIHDIKVQSADVVVAVGGGTIHDISRYSAYICSIPFVSVPTAPSVDGFNSKGAPIILRGDKVTIPAIGPEAIFADLDVLMQAPASLVAAGFGDMLGKYTSLFDWRFGSLVGGEPYDETTAEITRAALSSCVDNVEAIARRSEQGIRILIGALIESGLAMLLFGQSHPASGAEHHLSHYWEMESIRLGKKQLLHGAKVGVACAEISSLYHRLSEDEALDLQLTGEQWSIIRQEIDRIPDPGALRSWLRQVGGPVTVSDLPVSEELLHRSLQAAHRIRPNRYTLLRAYNERL